ncbi:periplasmic heavy metal sensor [Pseudooceanicola sp.]|uniref:periplasmic heavy metal sensor n=1 Tax=Pseudooceanicola sp. TaxID=1914328 RepID=UPI002618AAAA|nr:periplasmic heavy metal sensor [Pseudooceanicola sp.]MDF1854847.1 periplasmic heavy metal sensor [Pseudooceanicola sp.]
MSDRQNLAPEPEAPKAPRLWLRLVLFGSLALNLLVVGAVGGMLVFGPPEGRDRPPRSDRIGGPLTQALTHEDRRDIGRALREAYRGGRPDRGAMRDEYQRVIAALRSDPFDADEIADSLSRQLGAATERQKVGQEILLDHLRQMSVAERAAYADRLQEGLRHDRKRDD